MHFLILYRLAADILTKLWAMPMLLQYAQAREMPSISPSGKGLHHPSKLLHFTVH
jgi:hypothetical protein